MDLGDFGVLLVLEGGLNFHAVRLSGLSWSLGDRSRFHALIRLTEVTEHVSFRPEVFG